MASHLDPAVASNVNPANAITAARFLTLPPFLWAVGQGRYQVAAVLVVICAVLDLFDGIVARAFHCTTSFGEVFDAIADGFCYGFFMVVLIVYGWVPWPPVAIILALGIFNLGLRTAYARRAGRRVNYRSFAMERCVGFAAYLCGFGTTRFEVDYFYWTYTAVMAVVVVHDVKRMLIDPVPPAESVAPASAPTVERRGGAMLTAAEEA